MKKAIILVLSLILFSCSNENTNNELQSIENEIEELIISKPLIDEDLNNIELEGKSDSHCYELNGREHYVTNIICWASNLNGGTIRYIVKQKLNPNYNLLTKRTYYVSERGQRYPSVVGCKSLGIKQYDRNGNQTRQKWIDASKIKESCGNQGSKLNITVGNNYIILETGEQISW